MQTDNRLSHISLCSDPQGSAQPVLPAGERSALCWASGAAPSPVALLCVSLSTSSTAAPGSHVVLVLVLLLCFFAFFHPIFWSC